MIFRWQLRSVGWLLAFILTIFTFGCDNPSVYEPVGPNLPISNQRIINQATHGTPTMGSSIYELYDDGNGGFYFWGILDGSSCMGTIDRNGQQGWIDASEVIHRGLCPLSDNNIGLTEAVISVGGIDTDDDDIIDEAFARLLGSGGVIIDELSFSRVDTAMYLSSVNAIGPLSFVAVGGAKTADIYYPFVTTFKINPDSTLEMNNELIFSDYSDLYCRAVQVDADQVSGDDFLCYVSTTKLAIGDEAETIAIHAMTGSTSDIGAFDLTWTVDISQDEPLDIWTYTDCLVLHDGTLYLSGSADVEKVSNPSSGYWDAGFVSSVSTSGNLNWITMVSISTHSENYYNLYVTDDALYAAGKYSGYYSSDSNTHFGLALLSIFDTDTGDEIYHLGFGSEEYSSGFNALHMDGASAFCAGWTDYSTSGGGFQSWFAEVDIEILGGSMTSELPTLVPAMKAEECLPSQCTQAKDER